MYVAGKPGKAHTFMLRPKEKRNLMDVPEKGTGESSKQPQECKWDDG